MVKKAVVLGHSGFLGSEVYKNFLEEKSIETYGISSAQINLTSREDCNKLTDILDKNTALIMIAAIDRKRGDDLYSLKANINMATNLSEVILNSAIDHFVYVSTISVYGKASDNLIKEDSKHNPDNFYSASKSCCEAILKQFCTSHKIPLAILRPGTIYGKHDCKSNLFKLVNNVLLNNKVEIYGDGSHRMFPIYKKDLSNMIKSVVFNKKTGEYNLVANGSGYSLLELAKKISGVFNKKINVEFKHSDAVPLNLRFDTEVFAKNFYDIKLTGLEEGLKDYYDEN